VKASRVPGRPVTSVARHTAATLGRQNRPSVTITVPPDMLAKTAHKRDQPSAAWRRSCARRTGAKRGFATATDPAGNDIARGWCRLTRRAPLMLFTATLLTARNQRLVLTYDRIATASPALKVWLSRR
jgi:hypothetical protein